MLQPLMLAQAFGVMDYPKIFSLSQAVSTLGIASGPVLLGAITATHGYLMAFLDLRGAVRRCVRADRRRGAGAGRRSRRADELPAAWSKVADWCRDT